MKMTRFSILSFIMLLVIVFIHPYADAQMSQGGVPYSFRPQKANASRGYEQRDLRSQENIPIIEMPALRRGAIDSIKTNYEGQFAYDFSVNIDVKASSWVDSISIGEIYRLKIKSDGAKSLNLIFSKYHLPGGAKLFIYSSDMKSLIGAFTSNNNSESGVLPTTPIYGDEIVVEYFEPCYARSQGKLVIGKVNHDFLGTVSNPTTQTRDGQYGQSGTCMVDVNCSEGADWQTEKRAVCRLLLRGKKYASGTLVNNTSFDGTPYILTANHAISTQLEVDCCVVYFNYESPVCQGDDGDVSQSVQGGTLIATNYETDFTLFELLQPPFAEWNPYYAGWDRHETHGAGGVCIHHPQGDVKKISTFTISPITSECRVSPLTPLHNPSNFYLIDQWIPTEHGWGVTESSSSGSPLFNNHHKVIGQLYGDCENHTADCDTPSNDYSNYGKFHLSWEFYDDNQDEQLRNWLDPIGCDSMVLDGAEVCPYEVNYNNYYYLINVVLNHHFISGAVEIYRARFNIYSTDIIDSGATIDYWANQSIHLQPGFHAKQGSLFNAKVGRLTYFSCVPGCFTMLAQMLDSTVYLGEDLCFLQTHAKRYLLGIFDDNQDVIWVDGDALSTQICNPLQGEDLIPGHYTIRLEIENECYKLIETFPLEILDTAYHSGGPVYMPAKEEKGIEDIYETNSSEFSMDVFPNPTQGKITLQVISSKQKPYSIEMISSTGSLLYKIERVTEDRIVIDKTGFPSGVYFIRLNNGEQIVTKKMIINK